MFLCACDRSPSGGSRAAPAAGGAEDKVNAEVIRIVAEQMGVKPSELKPTTHLVNDLKADDLDQVELVMEVEDTFEISIPDEDAEKLQTIGQWVEYVRARPKDPKARSGRPVDRAR
jgi:acyl carrier protein